ncbi:membrane protein of ER body-like protein isoform X2 [Coffea eugenioides]|uniref:membrane protein of ER body-like protein isoform X2 n=1 Tax=Coffea eugenioides TaxID=49369 RepID=UPI000F609D9B|nr:membrane protein of ER body-like protein isoform X2 [Coffea eugenioides]
MAEEEEQKWEQEEELERVEELSSLKLRRSSTARTTSTGASQDTSATASTATCTSTTSQLDGNGNCKTNGRIIEPPSNSVTENEVDLDGSVLDRDKREGPDKIAALFDSVFHNHTRITDAHSRSEPCVYYDKDGGSRANSTFCGDDHVEGNTGVRIYETREGNSGAQKSCDSVIDCRVEGNKKDSSNLTSLQHSPVLYDECSETYKSQEIQEIENDDIDLINGSGLDVTELDVERVLEKQNTHDLYCPNCNSCITRRVILRKRKRQARITSEDVRRKKLETEVESSLTHCSRQGQQATSIEVHTTEENPLDDTSQAAEKYERERETDVFRCLSCFSFFIPTGNGFKLFKIFGDKAEKKPVKDEQKLTSKSGISSTFASDRERTSEPGNVSRSEALTTNSSTSLLASHGNGQDGQSFSMLKDLSTNHGKSIYRSPVAESEEDGDKISPSSKEEILINGKEVLNAGDNCNNTIKNRGDAAKGHFESATGSQPNTLNNSVNSVAYHQSDSSRGHFEAATGSQPNTSNNSIHSVAYHQSDSSKAPIDNVPVTNGESLIIEIMNGVLSPEGPVPGNQPDGLKLLISSPGGSPASEKSRVGQNPDLSTQNNGADGAYLNENSPQTICNNKEETHFGKLFKINKDPAVLSVKGISLNQDIPATIAKDLRKVAAELNSGKDTVIVVESEAISTVASQRQQDLTISEETVTSANLTTNISVTESTGADVRQAYEIEIIRSIVYGGLVESITSLGVVSSAAGGDATTLNILALTLANVIGGLVLIGHNLWDLKKEQVTEQMDRYKELLGSRENFLLHTIVVTLSFVVFGLIPPIVYGFSFLKSGNRELKLLAAAAASLLCILVLATGKEYVRRPPKSYVKTIAYYILLGFMASGISYAVGQLIKSLLEKLHFQSNSPVFQGLSKMMPTAAEWASY